MLRTIPALCVLVLLSQAYAQLAPPLREIQPPVAPRGGTPVPAVVITPAKVVELTLEDPRTPESKCFLDLDTGKVFTLKESNPDDFSRSERWMLENGIDLKSDTIFPNDNYATYELALLEGPAVAGDVAGPRP